MRNKAQYKQLAIRLLKHQAIKILALLSAVVYLLTFVDACTNNATEKEAAQQSDSLQWQNHALNTKYTGSKSCQSCHSDIYNQWLETGKGKAFDTINLKNLNLNLKECNVYDANSNFRYKFKHYNNRLFLIEFQLKNRDTLNKREIPVSYVIGSGNQTKSFLTFNNGFLYELPVTHYTRSNKWDLSPGYENGKNSSDTRPVEAECLACHNESAELYEGALHRYKKISANGISCESCHGPGELHIQKHQSTTTKEKESIDRSIVNPAHLSADLQMDVCSKCHLEGVAVKNQAVNFKPGMQLSSAQKTFIPVSGNRTEFGFAGHAERLRLSKCYLKSEGKLNCSSCHNAHEKQNPDPLSYAAKCQSCHGNEAHLMQCSQAGTQKAPEKANCISCHMYKGEVTDIPHVSSTDHYIRRKPDSDKKRGNITDLEDFSQPKASQQELASAYLNYYEQFDASEKWLQSASKLYDAMSNADKVRWRFFTRSLPEGEEDLSLEPATDARIIAMQAKLSELKNKPYLRKLELAATKSPYRLNIQTELAEAYIRLNLLEQAEATISKVLALQPQYAPAKNSLQKLNALYGRKN